MGIEINDDFLHSLLFADDQVIMTSDEYDLEYMDTDKKTEMVWAYVTHDRPEMATEIARMGTRWTTPKRKTQRRVKRLYFKGVSSNDDVNAISIEPSGRNILADKDFGKEDGGGLMNNLSGAQFRVPAKVILSNNDRFGNQNSASSIGYLVNFEMYRENNTRRRADYEMHFGKPAAPFVQILDDLSEEKRNLPYKLYFDNLFTNINMLKKQKIVLSLRENLVPMSLPLTDCHRMKPVNVKRYFQTEKFIIHILRPNLIGFYNSNRGDTDLMDEEVAELDRDPGDKEAPDKAKDNINDHEDI
ncbi:hypothetical protein ILUMI_22398 [Ignelater luminosus]|uniref:PiggyBac transposable element-derived protein domain-containing protein n=1 Tax=Ignelater luminosus TaxID=2038154 RepID=A0A8K0G0L6_IGNLU|nr:hypothetical protein ILUMI_22398 [Ignelater luminosus]